MPRLPLNYSPATPTPLIIAFHGHGGRGDTFGVDVGFINEVLDRTFDRCNIDASRIALLGFSDGASCALSLGVSNGDQLKGVVAFSPGFYLVDHPHGAPSFFISHGIQDTVLPIEPTSRRIVVPRGPDGIADQATGVARRADLTARRVTGRPPRACSGSMRDRRARSMACAGRSPARDARRAP
ncbi:MAG: hypothetical protein ABIR92_10770 [Gemmatimonadaceae bacterium]